MPTPSGLPHSAQELSSCRDAVAELQGFVANIFMTLMPSAAARQKMRLTGISQPLLPHDTVWYLWRDDFPGVFLLQLGEADLHAQQPGFRAGARGRFWIKYFPALENDPAFDGLSVHEQALRLGPLFDDTGTPVLENWPDLPEGAFHVGYLELEFNEAFRLLRVECTARDVWRVRRDEPLDVEHNGERVRLLEVGELDRHMRGWELAWPVFDTLVTALGLFHAVIPVGCLLWHTMEEDDNGLVPARRLVLHLPCFLLESDTRQPALWDVFGVLQPDADLCEATSGQLDWLLVQPPEIVHPWLNPLWWLPSTDQDLADAGLCCLIGHDTDNTNAERSPA